jgi:tetratricopeptide (TPR) repeat protein
MNTASSEGDTAPVERLAIFEMLDAQKIPVGIVALVKTTDSEWSLQCSSEEDSLQEKLRAVAAEYAAARQKLRVSNVVIPAPDLTAVTIAFEDAGYLVEVIPAFDHVLSFQMSPLRGGLIGTFTPLHPLATSKEMLGRQILENIAKAGDELAREIDALLAQKDSAVVVTAIRSAADKGIFSLPASEQLLNAMSRFDVTALTPDDRRFIREHRLVLANQLRSRTMAGMDAAALLIELAGTLSPQKTVALKTAVALGEIAQGHPETGLSILRDLLDSGLDAEGRAWTWRNIGVTLDRNNAETRRALQLSADAFLEAGDRQEASKSLMLLFDASVDAEPAEAVEHLNELMSDLDGQGLMDRHVRSAALHARSNRLARLGDHATAFRDACEAVNLRRGLLGADEIYVSSLHLAAVEAHMVGDESAAGAFEEEADALTDKLKLSHFQLVKRVDRLTDSFNAEEAVEALAEAQAAGNIEVIVAIQVLQATLDRALTDTERLQILENTLDLAGAVRGHHGMLTSVHLAMGQLLRRMGQPDRAEKWFVEVLRTDGLDTTALNELVICLWAQEKWGDAALLLGKQLTLRGELPGVAYALGRSQFEAGDLSGAVTTLTKVINNTRSDEPMVKVATDLRERALKLGGTLQTVAPAPELVAVTRAEFEGALDEFARFVAAEKRKRFWVASESGGRKWAPSPERLAQDLLHTALKARFAERVDIFEELGAGAGRLDLYAKFAGGLALIVELKMCGGSSYSSAYAASGEEQIKHYMEQRRTYLGYLVVFDGRTKKFGDRILQFEGGAYTVIEKFVDVRNTVRQERG